jgi:hypothetical protein
MNTLKQDSEIKSFPLYAISLMRQTEPNGVEHETAARFDLSKPRFGFFAL